MSFKANLKSMGAIQDPRKTNTSDKKQPLKKTLEKECKMGLS
jgi:hypothetical protein